MNVQMLLTGPVAIGIYALLLGFALSSLVWKILKRRLPEKSKNPAWLKSVRAVFRYLLMVIPLLFLKTAQPVLKLPAEIDRVFSHVLNILIILGISWISVRLIRLAGAFFLKDYDVNKADNLAARKVHTQAVVIERILIALVAVIAISSILMTFDQVRQLGVSLLASAGIASVIIGFAAQKSIATVFAGIQIALTQPIRIDDVVIVEGEWGWVEEINLSYVVVRLWDLRRQVLPITYFIDHPFQNWTRTSSDMLFTASVFADYTLPLEPLREEFRRILESTSLWNRKAADLQVVNATESTIEIRALMSADDASKGWDLRCLVREKLIGFIRENYSRSLPRIRVESDVSPESGLNGQEQKRKA